MKRTWWILGRTTSIPKSALRSELDKVRYPNLETCGETGDINSVELMKRDLVVNVPDK